MANNNNDKFEGLKGFDQLAQEQEIEISNEQLEISEQEVQEEVKAKGGDFQKVYEEKLHKFMQDLSNQKDIEKTAIHLNDVFIGMGIDPKGISDEVWSMMLLGLITPAAYMKNAESGRLVNNKIVENEVSLHMLVTMNEYYTYTIGNDSKVKKALEANMNASPQFKKCYEYFSSMFKLSDDLSDENVRKSWDKKFKLFLAWILTKIEKGEEVKYMDMFKYFESELPEEELLHVDFSVFNKNDSSEEVVEEVKKEESLVNKVIEVVEKDEEENEIKDFANIAKAAIDKAEEESKEIVKETSKRSSGGSGSSSWSGWEIAGALCAAGAALYLGSKIYDSVFDNDVIIIDPSVEMNTISTNLFK